MYRKYHQAPVRIISNSLAAARVKRLRVSWFLLGTACGFAAASGIFLLLPLLAGPVSTAVQMPATGVHESRLQQPVIHVPAPITVAAQPAFPAALSLRIGTGDTLLAVLTDTGISYEEAEAAVTALRKIYDPRKIDAGLELALKLLPSKENPQAPILSSLSLPVSKTTTLELKRSHDGSFRAEKIEAPLVKKLVRTSGQINSSFYQTGTAIGIPVDTLTELIRVYSYDVDFQRDIQRGSSMEVLLERMETEDGIATGYGDAVYASLDLGKGRKVTVYRHKDKSGNVDYYNEKGESLRKALLRTPINGARITSRFGMRTHPILGYSKMHRGVDFGALSGTPIYAAGDGVVDYAGWKGGYGNYVRIQHGGKYASAYGHASRIAKGIKPGTRVKQGQVIAYVGSTGQSTGPHLHYEVMVNDKQVNPAGVKFKTGNSLTGKELAAFKMRVEQIKTAMNVNNGKKIALR
jgi:murein DD-endopeptidase MepM/ murein hydrolase activator NlpD